MAKIHCKEWEKAIDNIKHKKMVKYNIFIPVDPNYVPNNVKLMNFSSWAMKKKASGVHQAQLVLCCFKQIIEGQNYLNDNKSAL